MEKRSDLGGRKLNEASLSEAGTPLRDESKPVCLYATGACHDQVIALAARPVLISTINTVLRDEGNGFSYKAMAYANRGLAYMRLKMYQQALDDTHQALRRAPQLAHAYYCNGQAYLGLSDMQHAQASIARSWELDTASCKYGFLLVWIEMCHIQPSIEMTGRLQAIAEVDPEHYSAHVSQAVALWLEEKFEEALPILEQARALEPNEWDTYFWIAMVYASLERDEEAMVALNYSIELGLPQALLTPLAWFKQKRPEFYAQYAQPLLPQTV